MTLDTFGQRQRLLNGCLNSSQIKTAIAVACEQSNLTINSSREESLARKQLHICNRKLPLLMQANANRVSCLAKHLDANAKAS
jgi:hypothetical protein